MEVKKLKNYINGQWVESKTDQWLEVRNPAKDEVIALCPETTKEEVDRTVKAAQEVFWSWRITPPPGVQNFYLIFMKNFRSIRLRWLN